MRKSRTTLRLLEDCRGTHQVCDLCKAELQEKNVSSKFHSSSSQGQKILPVTFHVYNSQISIKIKLKFLSAHYH